MDYLILQNSKFSGSDDCIMEKKKKERKKHVLSVLSTNPANEVLKLVKTFIIHI